MKRAQLIAVALLAAASVTCSSNGDDDPAAEVVEPHVLVDSACGSDATLVTVGDDTPLEILSSGDASPVLFESDGGPLGFALAASALNSASSDLIVQLSGSDRRTVATLHVSVEGPGERASDVVCEAVALDAGKYEIFTESNGVEFVSFGVFHLPEGTN